jgi:GDP-4-dehydro-6-deoxy-D-mannose reductase
MTTTLVTGAAGFLAGHLAPVLRRRGPGRLVGADVRGRPVAGYDAWHTTDLTDGAATRELVATVAPSLVFHLVGATHGDAAALHASNVDTAAKVLEAVRASNSSARIVLVGSAAEYGRVPADDQPVREEWNGTPGSAYGRSKREVSGLAARAEREFGLHVVVARPFNVLGAGVPESLVVGAFIARLRAALAGSPPRVMRVGTVSSVRDFVAVEDVAEGLVLAAERGRAGDAYNFCSGSGHAVAELLGRLLEFAGVPVGVQHDETLVRPGEVDALIGSWEKANRELGWRPTIPFEASLRAAWDATAPAEIIS